MEIVTAIVVIVLFAAAISGVVGGSFAQIETGWWGIMKSSVLWAGYGALAGLFNGPQIKSGEHPTLLTTLSHVLTLALPLMLCGAVGGGLFALTYDALAHGSLSSTAGGPVLRVATALAGGAVLGAIGGLLLVQIIASMAAVFGAMLTYKPDENLIQWAAESAQGMMQEGGIFAVWAGAGIGTVTGVVIGTLNR